MFTRTQFAAVRHGTFRTITGSLVLATGIAAGAGIATAATPSGTITTTTPSPPTPPSASGSATTTTGGLATASSDLLPTVPDFLGAFSSDLGSNPLGALSAIPAFGLSVGSVVGRDTGLSSCVQAWALTCTPAGS